VLPLILLALPLACPQEVAAAPEDGALPWREDLRFMAREMERLHKNLYHSVSAQDFAAQVAELEGRLEGLERHEIIVELARIVASVGDGHTNIYPTRDPRIGFRELPVAFTFFEEGLYLRAAHESQRALVGARVLKIGELDVAAAYESVKSIIGRDNEQGARYWAPYLLAIPEVLHGLHITTSLEDVPLTLQTEAGEQAVVLHPWGPLEIMHGDIATLFDRRPGWVDVRDLSGRPDPAWLCGAGRAFRFEHMGELLYVQLNAVRDEPDETLAAFALRVKQEIERTEPAKLALDLRLDRGGDGTLLVPLIRALIQSQSIDRPGHLFAFIGPATFSAAQMCASALEEYTQVTFVGEPTGSRGNHYGDSRKILLPNSGITVRVSVFYWQLWHPLDEREATLPGIAAPLTFTAYRENRDPALEAIR